MSNKKIIHILNDSFILNSYIEFVNQKFSEGHTFINYISYANHLNTHLTVNINIKSVLGFIEFLKYLYKADKIILHGIFDDKLVVLLLLQPWIYKKCYFVMWGGDFYFPEKQSWVKKVFIKRIRHFITYIKGDFDYLRLWYGAKGKCHECFMYPSNLYKDYEIKTKKNVEEIVIQVGNSAYPTNNHFEILDSLLPFKDKSIKLVIPLSYGDMDYAKKVEKKAHELFKGQCTVMKELVSLDTYIKALNEVDIAIFAHKRQQGMGNTINLLGLGKKVFIRSSVPQWSVFEDIGVKVYDFDFFNIDLIDIVTQKNNQAKIKAFFSEENYLKQWKTIFEL